MFDYGRLRDQWYQQGWFSERTCIDAFESGAREHGSMPVTFIGEESVSTQTVAEIHHAAVAVAAGLQHRGLRAGDRVAVQLTNRVECAVAYQAVLLCGAVLVPIVHIYGAAEVDFILTESGAEVLIMPVCWRSIDYLERVQQFSRIETLRDIVVLDADAGDGFSQWPDVHARREDYRRPQVAPDDVCLIVYTSGTTSAPKGVQHTHNTVLAEQRTLLALFEPSDPDVSLVSFPPGHIAGVACMLQPLLLGRRTVFMAAWDPVRAVDVICEFGVTSTAGAPLHLEQILDLGVRLDSLHEFLVGAAPVTEDLGRRAAAAGISTFRSYGSSEHPTVTGEHSGSSQSARLATDGRPLPGSTVRILSPAGTDCTPGVDGEVVVQGPEQFIGYRDSALNDDAFTADGRFRTGDLGHLDAGGRLVITDRIKDVIIRAGETVSSGQVEDVLNAHPAVAEGAAVAAPHPRYGETIAAVVVLHPDCELDLDTIRIHIAASGLARQKTPEQLVIVDALPRTALGKVRKAELRADHFGVEVPPATQST